jgi:hypothetical protein
MTAPAEIKANEIVTKTLKNLADDPDVNLSKDSADRMKANVTNEITSVVMNQTNQEPWYQSRVILFSIGAILTTGYSAGLDFLDGTPPTVEAFSGYAAALVMQFGVLYGRLIAAKPLGQ